MILLHLKKIRKVIIFRFWLFLLGTELLACPLYSVLLYKMGHYFLDTCVAAPTMTKNRNPTVVVDLSWTRAAYGSLLLGQTVLLSLLSRLRFPLVRGPTSELNMHELLYTLITSSNEGRGAGAALRSSSLLRDCPNLYLVVTQNICVRVQLIL